LSKFKLTPISNPEDVTIFNSSDVNSGSENITSGSLNNTLLNYLSISGGTITGDLGITQGTLYIGSEEQTLYTSAKDAMLSTIQTKTQNINFGNGKTKVYGDVDFIGSLSLNNKLSASMIGNGDVSNVRISYLNSLNGHVQTQLNSLNGNINSLQSLTTTHTSSISGLQSFQTNQESSNTTNDTNISSINTFQTDQETYNTRNDTNISSLNTFQTKQIKNHTTQQMILTYLASILSKLIKKHTMQQMIVTLQLSMISKYLKRFKIH
jgi:hypothetical protein